jgi:hypothetical protein
MTAQGQGSGMAKAGRIAALATLAALMTAPAGAQQQPATPQAVPPPIPQTVMPDKVWPASAAKVDFAALQKLPDWRGIWAPIMGGGPKPEIPQLLGKYKAHYDETQKLIKSGDPEALLKVERRASACEPPGMPGIMSQPYNIEFLFTPGRVTIIQEAYMQVRRVFTDGRPLPDDPDPTYNGASIGKWDGDTLVVTTVGLRDGGTMGRWGITYSDKVKQTERIHLDPKDKDVMIVENSFEDPKALAAPWHSVYRYKRQRGFDQIEFICAQNDRNPINEKGEVEFRDVQN